jgi:low temperature requirement protein LtrA
MRYLVAYIGIFLDILLPVFFWSKLKPLPAHTEHLVERLGLLTLILLGESVISLSGGLSNIQWDRYNVMTAITGFIMICSIWWIYFDSFYLLSKNESSMSGHSLIYSHLFLFMGLALLANLIRHAILNDIAIRDFQIMSIIGMALFFLGKQYGYFIAVPKIRKYILQNTLIVLSLAGLVIFLPRVEYILVGLTATMICYVFLNFRYR